MPAAGLWFMSRVSELASAILAFTATASTSFTACFLKAQFDVFQHKLTMRLREAFGKGKPEVV